MFYTFISCVFMPHYWVRYFYVLHLQRPHEYVTVQGVF